jgi:hypothetical protein
MRTLWGARKNLEITPTFSHGCSAVFTEWTHESGDGISPCGRLTLGASYVGTSAPDEAVVAMRAAAMDCPVSLMTASVRPL